METSREDVGIAIRSAFLRTDTKQRFSLFFLILFSIILIFFEKIETKPLNYVRSFVKDGIYRVSQVASYPVKSFGSSINFIEKHINLNEEYKALEKENQVEAIELFEKLCDVSNLGHLTLLPDLITKTKKKSQIDQLSRMIQGVCDKHGSVKEHLALLAIMHLNIDEKIVMQSFYEFLSNEVYFSELLDFNNMESISELINKELINNIRVKLNQRSINKFKYLCKNCGYKTIKFSWQCPTCRNWESSDPINFITNND